MAGLRYLITMMGLFSVYNGAIYNDLFSVKMPFMPTCYDVEFSDKDGTVENIKRIGQCTYSFGLDWAWGYSSNEVTFFNSFKMKMSIVIGVIHMCLGILMKGVNSLYFGSAIDFLFEFVPQIFFMTSLFGYMVFLIFAKWARNWEVECNQSPEDGLCPAIINTFTTLYKVGAPVLESRET